MDDSDGIAPPATPVLGENGAGTPYIEPQSTPQPVYEERNGRASAVAERSEEGAKDRTAAPLNAPELPHLRGSLEYLKVCLRDRTYRLGGWVYFIQGVDGGLVKIGYSSDVHKRLRRFQLTCPVRLRVVGLMAGSRRFEELLHVTFSDLRRHGEWFEPRGDLAQFIERHARRADSWYGRQARGRAEWWPLIPLGAFVAESEKPPRSRPRPRHKPVEVTEQMIGEAADLIEQAFFGARDA